VPRIVVAAAVAVALVVAVLPPARAAVASAVDGILRFAGIQVHQVPGGRPRTLPSPRPLPSAHVAGLDEARRAAAFPVRLPANLGDPQRVEVADPGPDGAPRVVSLFYRDGTVRLDEFDGTLEPAFFKRAYDPAMDFVRLREGVTAMWFPTPHEIEYVDRQGTHHVETTRLAGTTLVWAEGSVTYRLEGIAGRDEAVAVARSVR
jgi:hypothetical protein